MWNPGGVARSLSLSAASLVVTCGCLGPNPRLALEGEDEHGSDSETGAGQTGGSEGPVADLPPGECGAAAVCVPTPVAGWAGPLRVYVGPVDAEPPSCSGSTPEVLVDLFTELDEHVDASTCACECGPLSGASCSEVTLRRAGADRCQTTAASWALEPDACVDFGAVQATSRWAATGSTLVGGACSASVVAEPTPADFAVRVRACAPFGAGSECEAGVCSAAPSAPFDGRVCLAQAGALPCPAGPYRQRSVYHAGLDDLRGCSECGCSPPTELACAGQIRLSSAGCAGQFYGNVAPSSCSAAAIGSVAAARFDATVPDADCLPSPGAIEGEVVVTEPWTFCCT